MANKLNGQTKRIAGIATIVLAAVAVLACWSRIVERGGAVEHDVEHNASHIDDNIKRLAVVEPKVEAHMAHLRELETRITFSREVQLDILKANRETQQDMKAMRRDMSDGFKEVLTKLADN